MPRLSVIIPVYNEKDTVLKILEKVLAVNIDKEIVIVDDCSTDGSREILTDLASKNDPRVKVLFHERNMGKGTAVRTALGKVSGDIVIIQDADLEQDPNDYVNLMRPLVENEADAVRGVRKHETLLHYGYRHLWLTALGTFALKLFDLVGNLLYRAQTPIKDVISGYKMVSVDVMKSLNLKSSGFDIDTEISAKLIKRGYRIRQVDIEYYPRTYKEGKKIKWWHTFVILYALFKYKFFD